MRWQLPLPAQVYKGPGYLVGLGSRVQGPKRDPLSPNRRNYLTLNAANRSTLGPRSILEFWGCFEGLGFWNLRVGHLRNIKDTFRCAVTR